jgi:hypothetical protein
MGLMQKEIFKLKNFVSMHFTRISLSDIIIIKAPHEQVTHINGKLNISVYLISITQETNGTQSPKSRIFLGRAL